MISTAPQANPLSPMKSTARRGGRALLWRSITVVLLCAGVAAEELQTADLADTVDEVVVTIGTRHAPRTATDSVVPVDVFDAEDLASVQSSDMLDVLGTVVPSFYVARHPIADGASFMRPTNLRGLDSHHALVLVDGKRRHRGAVLRLGSFGPHGVDIGGLPSIAFAGVEVLRDGAAAQYGSDAIAGVLNFKLREASSGFDVRARYGGYSAGDGEEGTLEATGGLPLGEDGFLTLSAQLSSAAATSRSEPYDLPIAGSGLTPLASTRNSRVVDGVTYYGPDALTYVYGADGAVVQILPGSDGVPDDRDTRFADNYARVGGGSPFASPVQIWGQPRREQAMLVLNAGVPVGEAELYGFGSYATREQQSGFFYRRPGVAQLLPVRLADGSIYDPRERLYPAGFTPQFSGLVDDYALLAGLRGERASGLRYDASLTYGKSRIRYRLENTLNPSLGPETPTRFRPGSLANDELAVNLDFAQPLTISRRLLNLAFGLEYRNEGYEVGEGGSASYAVGPFARRDPFNLEVTQAEVDADPNDALTVVECHIPGLRTVGEPCPAGDPINNALPIGSNGFPGYPPAFASDVGRGSYAAYGDVEADLTDRWLGNAALRVERFEDFGQVAIWKLASRYRLTERLNLRASLGTGFRAPTPGQISTTNVSTRIGGDGSPRAEGLFPATHPAAALFGALPLTAETSRSATAGIALDVPSERAAMTFTVDYYHIRLEDRITLSSQFPVGPAEASQLAALGVPGASDIAQVRFFVNDVRTRTQGMDVVANWQFGGALAGASVEAAVNFNRTKMLDRGRFLFNESQYDIEHGLPAMRGTLTARHTWRALDGMVRLRWFGKYSNAKTALLEDIQYFGREATLDAQVGWTWRQRYRLQLGAENLLDNYPDEAIYETCCGMVYRRDSIMPWQGRMVYAQVQAWR